MTLPITYPTSAFRIPGAPAELVERIAARRARIPAGMRMSLDAPEGQPQGDPTPAPPAPAPKPGPLTPNPKAPANDDVQDSAQAEADRLREENQRLRDENAEKRVRARDAEKNANAKLLDGLKALQEAGVLPEGVTLADDDPVKAAQDAVAGARAEADQARTRLVLSEAENVVWRQSRELGLNAAAINDSRSFGDAIKDLDPAADDFAAKVVEAAQAAASKNPSLKASASGRGGSELGGGTGPGRETRDFASLADAVSADYTR